MIVEEDEFGEELQKYMLALQDFTIRSNGVGLSGIQIADPRRIMIVFGVQRARKMVNPELVWFSADESTEDEGCLSTPGFVLPVTRPATVEVKWRNPLGEEKQEVFEDIEAHIVQHELDHLEGITLLDRASRLKRSRYTEKVRKQRKKMSRQFKKYIREHMPQAMNR
jgi:peptide deformylase